MSKQLQQIGSGFRALNIALRRVTLAVGAFARELSWLYYLEATGRSALSNMLRPTVGKWR